MRLCALKNADTRKYFSVLTKNGKEQAYKIKRLRHLIANQGHYLAQLCKLSARGELVVGITCAIILQKLLFSVFFFFFI